ncbi:granzyme B(G,H)-like [Sinocyclocheilus anshuiensis]|uniref:granzyme B(G,H)-like n=1 Tax=Sinocyclocheilus anshuiensis TaxID=1608454 RepID=UPI0007BA19C0|nr:PREDICTED: granzyme B(G,H)-like [Sinocyclocheilus anshuiensis]
MGTKPSVAKNNIYSSLPLPPQIEKFEKGAGFEYCSERLEKKVKLSQNVEPISLIKNKKGIKSGTVCSVAGWGRLQTKGSASDRLMEANVKIMKDRQCKEKLKGSVKYLISKMMCAYGRGGSCRGDSGGPLGTYNIMSFSHHYSMN